MELEADLRHAVEEDRLDLHFQPQIDLQSDQTLGTESVVMHDIDRVAARLGELRALGVHVSIDDFGTGCSSLQYLQRLPVDRLKVDRSFVQGIGEQDTEGCQGALVGSVVDMAHRLGLGVVAEGVETEHQARYLRELGCDEAQGFLFARPMPMEHLYEWLPARRADP